MVCLNCGIETASQYCCRYCFFESLFCNEEMPPSPERNLSENCESQMEISDIANTSNSKDDEHKNINSIVHVPEETAKKLFDKPPHALFRIVKFTDDDWYSTFKPPYADWHIKQLPRYFQRGVYVTTYHRQKIMWSNIVYGDRVTGKFSFKYDPQVHEYMHNHCVPPMLDVVPAVMLIRNYPSIDFATFIENNEKLFFCSVCHYAIPPNSLYAQTKRRRKLSNRTIKFIGFLYRYFCNRSVF